MYYFAIKDIENLCGIKAHTLRIWEQRYNLVIPKRKESQHRLYDNEDLKQFLRISFLYHHGWKISKIAQLNGEGLLQEIEKLNKVSNHAYYINQLIESAITFDKEAFENILNAIIDKLGFENCIIHVCYPFLQKVGLLWMTNRVIPAQEHFSSYVIQHKIIAVTDSLPLPPKDAREILLFCPHGEYHELPLYFINYLFKKHGWSTIFLGSNVNISLLQQFVDVKKINYLFLHVITNFTGFVLDDYFEMLCKTFAGKNIAASGTSIFSLQRNFTNLTLLKSDKEIYNYITQ